MCVINSLQKGFSFFSIFFFFEGMNPTSNPKESIHSICLLFKSNRDPNRHSKGPSIKPSKYVTSYGQICKQIFAGALSRSRDIGSRQQFKQSQRIVCQQLLILAGGVLGVEKCRMLHFISLRDRASVIYAPHNIKKHSMNYRKMRKINLF